MAKADGSIVIKVDVDSKKAVQDVSAMESNFDRIGQKISQIGKLIGSAFTIQQLVRFGKAAIELGSDLAEVQNVVDVTFGSLNSEVNAFAKSAVTQFGLSELSAKQFTSTMGAMLKSMGFGERAAADMGMTIAGLAGDMASFYNLDPAEAFYKIRSGISGETEPLKQLGVNLSVANLEQYALTQGINKSYDAMTQQEQALLRYNYLLSVTSDAQGDFVRTSDSWANQTRILSEQFNSLKATIGQGLISAFTPVIRTINTVLSGLQTLANAFQQVMALLFGGSTTGGTKDAVSGVADEYSQAASGAADLAKNTKAAGKAAEEAQKQLMGFDELNVLQDTSSSSGGGAVGASGGGGLAIEPLTFGSEPIEDAISPQIQEIVDKILDLIEPLRNIDFEPLKASLANLGGAFGDLGATIGDALEWAWHDILVPLSTWAIEELGPKTVALLTASMQSFGNVLKPVSRGIQNLFSTLSPVIMWIKDTVLIVMEKAIERAQKIASVFEEKGPEIEGIISGIGDIFLAVWELVEPIFTQQRKAWSKTYSFMTELIGNLISWIIDCFSGLVDFIAGVFTGDWDRAFAGIEKTIESCKEFLSDTWESVKELFSGVGAWVDENIIQPVSKFFTGLWSGIAQSASDCWSDICEFFRPAIDWFSELFGSVKQTIDDIFYDIGVIASGCWEIVKKAWDIASSWFDENVIQPVAGFFSDTWDSVTSGAEEAWKGIKEAFSSVGKFFSDTFTEAWEKVKEVFSPLGEVFADIKEGVLDGFKEVVNKLISGINNVVAIPFNGINDALRSVKSVNIFGIQPFSGLKTISVPQIPYLAQGAVIPPRAPFAAVLGDQRHGTNIEAPLETIQEAVARVTGDQSERMLAALYTLIEIVEQKDLNVQIGDDEIGRANARYKQARGVQVNSGAFANAY